ncbi:nuclear transport factor 2 family protein [Nocardia xishanensis]|uniref:nuclear transport factor 2 family protein n=1 Tax=Nocardia xishanensis TaxID=238964 RepID=UPI0033E9A6CA
MTATPSVPAEWERRLRRVEDELAIGQLVARYGPAVDAAAADAAAELWTEDGSYDVEGWFMDGRDEVRAMVRSAEHRGLVERGCTHFLGPVATVIEGDRATAVCESLLVVHRDGRFVVARAGANRFELTRTADGWKIQRRVTRALDGTPESRDLLALDR